ncbi:hypothetical protein EAH89_26525 [Roseomonas nepalensis]|uniref:Alpha/beta hydrolase n=1 Tax=Muricoccus nepalensis TaxID=1854500 RepID=A0A502F4Y9_9PROT|nr:hypothetical protein EAH89_26525 [Roseomonas nepalensis]
MVNPGTTGPDCRTRVNFDRNAELPGYRVEEGGRHVCIPFMPTAQLVPPAFTGDFYVQEFTDARIRARWADCRANRTCAEPARAGAVAFTTAERRRTGTMDPQGRVDAQGQVDLRAIRRPGFFARFGEPIAQAEPRAWTVEFTVPRDSYERRHLNLDTPIQLRGWYIEGTGTEDGAGARRRALIILSNGGGNEITGIDDPAATGVARNAAGEFVAVADASASEQPGMRHWRGFAAALNAAGFDVLVTDRRGNGISGGVSGYNTAEQARDLFRMLDALETGEGVRLLSPGGELLSGAAVRGRLLAGQRATDIPVVLAGYSRGSYATAWAMHQNFVEDCDRDVPDGACRPPLGRANIRGAILYGPNSGGLGWRVAGHDMIEAALRVERNTTYYPDGDVLAGVARWPALQIVKGTWDYVEGLEGSLSVLHRARGLRDIFVSRGPHPLNTQHPEAMRLVGLRMATFARAAVLGQTAMEGAREPADLRELVLSSPPLWEATTAPAN